jgi:hypothetical protein
MAKKLAFLEYSFIFDPVDTWSNLSQFEGQLAQFFMMHGLEAEIVPTVGGQSGRRIMSIKKAPDMTPVAPKPPKPGEIQKQVNKLRGGK